MKRILTITAALAVIAAFSCTKEELVQEPAQVTEKTVQDSSEPTFTGAYLNGTVIVRFNDEMIDLIENDINEGKVVTKSMALNNALDELGIVHIERLYPEAGEYEAATRESGLHRYYKVVYNRNNAITKAVGEFSAIPGVESVEVPRKIRLRSVNDPNYSKQWHFYNNGSGSYRTAGADINVEPVWENYTTGDERVIVEVVDGGIALTHTDLADNAVAAGSNGSYNFVNSNTTITADDHGTHVAGTIAAITNNGKGVAGIAGGDYANGKKGCKVMSCQIFKGNSGASDLNTGKAIKWGVEHGAVISQNSWGYYADENDDGTVSNAEYNSLKNTTVPSYIKDAIDYFVKYAGCDVTTGNQKSGSMMKGGIVFFAAGNEDIDIDPICQQCDVVAVGSFGPTGKKADYSNYGDWVDLAAPGGDSYVGYTSASNIYSLAPNNQYAYMEGTSMACPHASGVAALVVSYYGGDGFTNTELKERLIKGATTDIVTPNQKIGPKLDALGAITYDYTGGGSGSGGEGGDPPVVVTNPPAAVAEYSAEAKSNSIQFSWKVTADYDGNACAKYVVYASKSSLSGVDPKNPGSAVKAKTVNVTSGASVGTAMSTSITELDFSTEYHVSIVAIDSKSTYSELAAEKTVTTPVNNPPVITIGEVPAQIRAWQTVTIPVSVVEPDGHTFTVTYKSGSSADSFETVSTGSYNIKVNAPKAKAGSYTATVTATDYYKKAASQEVTYTVLENNPPKKIKDFDNIISKTVGEVFKFNVAGYFTDPDEEPLTYTVTVSDAGIVDCNVYDGELTVVVRSYGQTTVNVKAADYFGKNVVASFGVLVREPKTGSDAGEEDVDSYPNPVVSELYVRTGATDAPAEVKVISATGSVVFNQTCTFSAFNPLKIDMTGCAPGVYTLEVTYEGRTYKRPIVKR